MMKKLLMAGMTAVGMTLAMANAQAAFVGTTPASNDVIGVTEGWFDGNLYLSAGGPVNATIEFIGKEAGFINTFNINGGATEYTTGVSTPLSPLGIILNPGLINFLFTINSGAGSVANGANLAPSTNLPNFYVTFGPAGDTNVNGSSPGSGTIVLIALDDAGAGPDDNHDDLVVRLSLQGGSVSIPEPSTYALLAAGLLGLGFAARRRRS